MCTLMQDEPRHFLYAQDGGRIQFTFHRRIDGRIDVDFEPA